MSATFTAVFTPTDEGGYTVTVEELPVILTEGKTLEEAQQNLIYAIEDYTECLAWERKQSHKSIPHQNSGNIYRPISLSFA